MSSLFRARKPDVAGSGGKMLRGRRATPSTSPYSRASRPTPPPSSPAAPAVQMGSPRWFLGLISGAGKLISSVLPSKGSSSPSSSSNYYSSDEEEISSGPDEDAGELSSRELDELNQRGKEPEFVNNCMDGPLAIVPKSESKLVIEQLLLQETFSRDECNKLTKLIQSRVVDFPSTEVCGDGPELRSRTIGNDIDLPGASLSFSQKRKLPKTTPYSSSKLNIFSPESPAFEACTPDICNRAVMEAKKWLEEKKLTAPPKYDPECGPCTFNTDMLQYGFDCEVGSPVNMAKSYMRSLPPWRSPSLSSIGFRTPQSRGLHLYNDETSYATANSLPSSKVLKRDYHVIGSWDALEETRRVRLKSTDDRLEISKSRQTESSAKVLEHESSKSSSEADKRDLYVGDHYSDGARRLLDEKGVEVNTRRVGSLNMFSEAEETINVVRPTQGLSMSSAHSPKQTNLEEYQDVEECQHPNGQVDSISVLHDILASASRLEEHGRVSSTLFSKPEETINAVQPTEGLSMPSAHSTEPEHSHNLDGNQDVEESQHTKEQVDSISAPDYALTSASRLEEHGGNPLSDVEAVPPENIKSAVQNDADDVASLNDVQTSSIQTSSGVGGTFQVDAASQLNLVSGVEVIICNSDTRTQDGNSQIPKEANGLINKSTANGSSAEVDTSSDQEVISQETDTVAEKSSQNGTRMKSIERMLTEPQPNTSRRGRKSVVSRRGRRVKVNKI